jgi:Asp-tRNA(Asn)/Glu-tRNA(Gln) amidotransferase A subunit family amidase
VENSLERIAALDRSLNAFVDIRHDLDEHPSGGALEGIPIAIKDCFFHAGRVPTMGSRVHPKAREGTAEVIRRLEAAGAAIVGYTNLHEWAIGGTSAVTATGPIRNPWDTERVAGGSSGGSAAAVAAGLVPAAIGTDTGGSIRIPAACCGVVGLKPTQHAIPTGGYVGDGGPTDHIGVLAGTTDHLAAVFEVVAGATSERRDPSTMRVGIARGGVFDDVEPEVATAMAAAIDVVGRIVGSATDVAPEAFEAERKANRDLFLNYTATVVTEALHDTPELFAPSTLDVLGWALALTDEDLALARAEQAAARTRWARLFGDIDILVTPSIPVVAPRIDALEVTLPSGTYEVRNVMGPLAGPMDLVGVPSMSVPCGDPDGLPIGVSFTAAPGNDGWVIAMGSAFEDATDRVWAGRVAPGY